MKLFLVTCSSENVEEIRKIIDRHHVHGYTEIADLRGSGETGRRLGTRAYPGSAAMIFTAIPDEKVAELTEAIKSYCDSCEPGQGLKAFVLDAREVA